MMIKSIFSQRITMKQKLLFCFLFLSSVYGSNDSFYYNGDKKISLERVQNSTITRSIDQDNIIYYKTSRNITLGVTNEIIIKLKDIGMLDYLKNKYNFELIKEIIPNTYLVKIQDNEATLETANLIHNETGVGYASPNFLKSINKR